VDNPQRPPRRFPTSKEVAERLVDWYEDGRQPPGDPAGLARADQQAAAARDNLEGTARALRLGVAAGDLDSAVIDASGDLDSPALSHTAFATVRTLMVAESAGVEFLCPHDQGRPVILSADPPALACRSCLALPRTRKKLQGIGAQWPGECDRCGSRSTPQFGSQMSLGHLTVMATVCGGCRDMDRVAVEEAFEGPHGLTVVGRNRPCPCRSGKKFKRCHGRSTSHLPP
jgi:hypothetical protein